MSIESPEMDGYSDFVFVSPRGRLYTRETIATQIKRIINWKELCFKIILIIQLSGLNSKVVINYSCEEIFTSSDLKK